MLFVLSGLLTLQVLQRGGEQLVDRVLPFESPRVGWRQGLISVEPGHNTPWLWVRIVLMALLWYRSSCFGRLLGSGMWIGMVALGEPLEALVEFFSRFFSRSLAFFLATDATADRCLEAQKLLIEPLLR